MAEQKSINALGREAAYQLANVTKTAPQFAAITPRWVSRFLDYRAGVGHLSRQQGRGGGDAAGRIMQPGPFTRRDTTGLY